MLIVFNYVSANEGMLWGGDGMVYLQCDNKWYVSGLLSNITGTEWFKNGGAVRFKMRRFWVDFFRHKKPVWPTICTTIKLISLSQLGVEGVRIHISSHDAKNFSTSFHSESHNILSPRNTILQFVKILFTPLQGWFHVSLVTQMQRHFTQHWHCKALLQGFVLKHLSLKWNRAEILNIVNSKNLRWKLGSFFSSFYGCWKLDIIYIMISLLEYDYISILHYDIIICILLFDLSHLLPFTVVNVGYQSTLPATCPGVTMFPHFPMKYSEKYKNTKIQKYKNTEIQK